MEGKRLVTILATHETINLSTSFDYPPIPCRSQDWSAIDYGSYDASYEGEDESGSHWTCSPSGHGATEAEAITDLLEQLEDAFEPPTHVHVCQQCEKILSGECDCKFGDRQNWCSSNCRAAYDL